MGGSDLFSKCKGPVMKDVHSAMESVSFVYSSPVREFIKAQAVLRRKAGCSKNSVSSSTMRKEYEKLVSNRNDSAKAALSSLEGSISDATGARGQKAVSRLKGVAGQIASALHGDVKVNKSLQVQFYPASVLQYKDVDKSVEDALDLFIAFEVFVVTMAGGTSKQQLVAHDNKQLKILMGQLAAIINDRLPHQDSLAQIAGDAVEGLKQLVKAISMWKSVDIKHVLGDAKKQLSRGVSTYALKKSEYDVAEMRHKVASRTKGPVKPHGVDVENASLALYSDQKDFLKTQGKTWMVQRNYLPEIYHEIFSSFQSALPTMMLSVDLTANVSYVPKIMVNRTISEYDQVRYVLPSMILAQYKNKACVLKRYCIVRRHETRALLKDMVFASKLESFVAPRIAALFIDNSDVFLHLDTEGGEEMQSALFRSSFNDSVRNPILLIRHMLHAVDVCHRNGVVVGDIRPTSFILDHNSLPILHSFKHAGMKPQSRGVRESRLIEDWSNTDHFDPPEVSGGNMNKWNMKSDMFALGKTIGLISKAGASCLEAGKASEDCDKLVKALTKPNPTERWDSHTALNWSDDLYFKLQQELNLLLTKKKMIMETKDAIKKAQRDLEYAAEVADGDLADFRHRKKDMVHHAEEIKHNTHVISEFATRLEEDNRHSDLLRTPPYWWNKSDQIWEICPIDKESFQYQVFRYILEPGDPRSLNRGRDVKEKGIYKSLDLVACWRIESPTLWRKYAVERNNLRELFTRRRIKAPKFEVRRKFFQACSKLPGHDELYLDCNETYVLHGTSPAVISSICTNGVNERFTSAALFGKGSYFAEDSAKVDQYVQGDSVLGGHADLHSRLYPPNGMYQFPKYPLKAYYLFLCRYLGGYPVHVQAAVARAPGQKAQMFNLTHKGHTIWATADQRELAVVPGVGNPPFNYHSLVAELGGTIARFREFCQFHSTRVYPEYLICYSRK